MTATDELRRLLDERGAEYRASATGYSIDIGPHITAYANRSNTTLDVSMRNITPAQAIDATLGRGECHKVRVEMPIEAELHCSKCDRFLGFSGDLNALPYNFCPNCGRRVIND